MHRIDSEGHDDNRFVDEDANAAIAGTTLAADWLNALQEELINILIAAEIDPNKASNDQLVLAFQLLGGSKEWADILNKPLEFPPESHTHNYAALSHIHSQYALTSDFDVSKATNGYQKLPNGLIIQWGKKYHNTNPSTVIFPISFPTAAKNCQLTVAELSSVDSPGAVSLGTSGFNISWPHAPYYIYWMAIGY